MNSAFKEGYANVTGFQQQTTRKMMNLPEIKQELRDGEDENGFVKSTTSNHFNSQLTAIKEEQSSTSQADEDSVPLNKMTASLTRQVKTDPESEEEDCCELQNTAADYPAGYVLKREIIEVHTENHHIMDDEVNHRNTTKFEESGTEANPVIKSENDNWSQNFPDNNIDKQKNMFDLPKEMNKQQICGRIGTETEIPQTQDETLCQTKKNHKCSVCAKAFHDTHTCLQHMWKTHTGADRYSCELCGKGFKYLSQVQRHKIVHSHERPYSCSLCNQAFKHKCALQSHEVSCHSYERPHSCDMCDKAFKHKRDLRKHKLACHSNERPYSCDLCQKTFKLKEILRLHVTKVHSDETPYSCDMCNKAFKGKSSLRRHKGTCHSVERPYSCDVCNKAFKRKTILWKHKLCHSNERPFSCDLCKKTFKQKGYLDSHKRTVHSDD